MKRYKFSAEKITGKTVEILVEGNTERDALATITRNRFVMDLKSTRAINTDHIVDLEFIAEVKVDAVTLT